MCEFARRSPQAPDGSGAELPQPLWDLGVVGGMVQGNCRNTGWAACCLAGLMAACGSEAPSEPEGLSVGRTDAGPGDAGGPGSGDLGSSLPDPRRGQLNSGWIEGRRRRGALEFVGIPYAQPPVGDLRWRPPQNVEPWDGIRSAKQMSSPCVQVTGTFVSDARPAAEPFGSEDCLYLNVWTPSDPPPDGGWPVMVFLHGGGNIAGSTREPISSVASTESDAPLYDGARLAVRGGVVVVTLNYRLGAVGFLAMPELDAEADTGTSGNYGLMDQIRALRWVQNNISAFTGDPSRVMLFGQSGGGRDTILLVTSPLTDGLFHAAAVHSAPLGAPTQEGLRERAEELVVEMGCDGPNRLACMRQVSAGDMVTSEASTPLGLASAAFLPTVDGWVVVDQPRSIIARGEKEVVPLLLGTLEAEYSHRWTDLRAPAYPAAVRAMVGPRLADAVLAQYPLERFDSAAEAFVTMMSDRNVTCPHRVFARIASASGVPTWLYRFREILHPDVRLGFGAYHSSELLYLFQHMDGVEFPADPDDAAAEDVMLGYWTRFAETADPNGDGRAADPLWKPFRVDEPAHLSISARPELGWDLKAEDCDFWDSLR